MAQRVEHIRVIANVTGARPTIERLGRTAMASWGISRTIDTDTATAATTTGRSIHASSRIAATHAERADDGDRPFAAGRAEGYQQNDNAAGGDHGGGVAGRLRGVTGEEPVREPQTHTGETEDLRGDRHSGAHPGTHQPEELWPPARDTERAGDESEDDDSRGNSGGHGTS